VTLGHVPAGLYPRASCTVKIQVPAQSENDTWTVPLSLRPLSPLPDPRFLASISFPSHSPKQVLGTAKSASGLWTTMHKTYIIAYTRPDERIVGRRCSSAQAAKGLVSGSGYRSVHRSVSGTNQQMRRSSMPNLTARTLRLVQRAADGWFSRGLGPRNERHVKGYQSGHVGGQKGCQRVQGPAVRHTHASAGKLQLGLKPVVAALIFLPLTKNCSTTCLLLRG
jgi:hypothetical protein